MFMEWSGVLQSPASGCCRSQLQVVLLREQSRPWTGSRSSSPRKPRTQIPLKSQVLVSFKSVVLKNLGWTYIGRMLVAQHSGLGSYNIMPPSQSLPHSWLTKVAVPVSGWINDQYLCGHARLVLEQHRNIPCYSSLCYFIHAFGAF